MDKFTKTTEVDISNMSVVEEEAPQKGKAGKIISIIISLILAVIAWVYVMETDETTAEKEFKDIAVTVIDKTDEYKITADKVNVTLVGTNSQLVDVDPSKIIVKVDVQSQFKGEGDYYVTSNELFLHDDAKVAFKDSTVKVLVHVEKVAK